MDFQLCLRDIEPSQRKQASTYLCAICNCICHKTYLGNCKHIFCRKCVYDILSEQESSPKQITCPIDNSILNEEELFRGKFLDEHIDMFNCFCTNKGYGCGWKGRIKEFYNVHYHECIFIRNYYKHLEENNLINITEENKERNMQKQFMEEIIIIE